MALQRQSLAWGWCVGWALEGGGGWRARLARYLQLLFLLLLAKHVLRGFFFIHTRTHTRARPHTPLLTSATLWQLWDRTVAKFWSYGGLAVFFLGIPFTLHLIKERRGLTWLGLLAQGVRLPFSD